MAEYGYAYRSFSTYSTGTVRNEKREPVIIKPFAPSVPKSNGNKSSEGQVTRKKIVPVTSSRPYDDDSATEKYPSRGNDDDNQWHRQTSPVRGSPRKVDYEFPPSPTKVQHEANHPQRFRPVANSTGWHHTSHEPTPYYSTGAEGRKPIATNGTNGYGGPYYGGNREGRKPVGSTIRNDNHDGYNNGTNGYGSGDYGGNKERAKPVASTIRNGDYGTNGYGSGDYGSNKLGRKQPIGTIRKNDGYAGNKGGRNKKDNYDHNGYGGYSDDDDDRDHRDYGNYNRHNPSGPKISSDWTKAPRKGTQLSEPTHDIEKALELLNMEAAKRERSNANNDDYEYENDRKSSNPLANWAAPAPGNGSRLADLMAGKFDRGTGSPRSRSSMPMEPASPNKGGNYGSETDDHDRKGPMRTFENFKLSSRPRTPIIDSRKAEEMFKGTRV